MRNSLHNGKPAIVRPPHTPPTRWGRLLPALLLLLGSFGAWAQTVTIGSTAVPVVAPATSTFYKGPIYRSSATSAFNYSHFAYVYTAAELSAAGIVPGVTISSLGWLKADAATVTGGNNFFEVRLANTTLDTLTNNTTWGALKTGTTVTYSSSTQDVTGAAGTYFSVTNTTGFIYTGGNLLILTDWVKNGTASGAVNFVTNAAISLGAGNANSIALPDASIVTTNKSATSYGSRRPTLRLTAVPTAACTAPPTAGTAVASIASGCAPFSTSLTLTGASSTGSGLTYQWQQSSTGAMGTFTNITGATSNSYTATPSATTTYQAVVTCSGQSATSTPVTVTVTPLPTYAAVPFTEGFETWISRCDNMEVPGNNWRALPAPATGDASWRRDDQGATANWRFLPGGEFTPAFTVGAHSARFHTYGTGSGGQGALDLFVNVSGGTGTPTLSFDYINPTGTDKLEAFLSTDGGTTFTAVLFTQTVSASWTRYNVPLTGATATTVIRFRATSDFGDDDIGLDALSVAYVSCPAVAALTTNSVTTTAANVTFTAAAGATNYTVTYTAAGGMPVTVTPAPTASPIALSGLTQGTTYTVSVVTNCGGGSTSTAATTTFTTLVPAPANDECAGAISLTSAVACTPTSGTTTGATASTAAGTCVGTADDDVWYSFVATNTSHTVTVVGASGFDAVLNLRSGACPGTNVGACQDNTGGGGTEAITSTSLTVGDTYYVRVFDYFTGAGSGNFTICVTNPAACAAPTALATNTVTSTTANVTFTPGNGNTGAYTVTLTPMGGTATTVTPAPTASPFSLTGLTPNTQYTVSITGNCGGGVSSAPATTTFTTNALPPANDLCANAIAVTCGQTLTGTTVGATATGAPTSTCGTTVSTAGGVFYSYVGTGDIVTVSTCSGPTGVSGGGDTKLFVLGSACGAFTCIGGNDDSSANCPGGNSLSSTVSFTGVAGTTYYFYVQGLGTTLPFGLSVTCVAPPACAPITGLSATAITTNSANLTFTAGNGNTSYTVTYTPSGGTAQTATGTSSPIALTGLTQGTTYAVSVQPICSGGGTSAPTTTTFTTLVPAPANDECAGAISLTSAVTCVTTSGTTTGATASASVTSTCNGTADDDVWYSFVATNTSHTVTVAGASGFDAVLNLRSGVCPGVDVQCVDNSSSGGTETITATGLTIGATYYARVYHYFAGAGSGNFTICVTNPAAPVCNAPTNLTVGSIAQTSASVSFTAGTGNTSFTATATPQGGGTAVTGTGNSPIALTGLVAGTAYNLSLQALCSGGGTTAAVTTTFTTTAAPCNAPTALTASAITASSATVSFTGSASATGYTVTTSPVTTTQTLVATATSVSFTGLSASTAYTVSIVSNCAAGATSSAATVTFTTTAPAPNNLTVLNGQNLTASGPYGTITVQSGGTLTLTGPTSATGAVSLQTGGILSSGCQVLSGAGSFTMQAGSELQICDAAGISLNGATGSIQVTGTRSFAPDASYTYAGTVAQVTGSGLPATVRNLTVNNAAGLSLSTAQGIAQVLLLQSGNLNTSAQTLTLLSDANGTALVNNAGGVVTGTGTMQRAITNAVSGPAYRHFSSPVVNTTLNDLTTSGFAPTFNTAYNTAPVGNNVMPFPTVFGYDQSRVTQAANSTQAFDQGFFSPTAGSDPMVPTRGYTVNAPATSVPVDFVGTFNNAAQNSGALARGTNPQSGWQLLGNPYPSPLDWSTVGAAQRPGMDAAMYVYQSTGQYSGTYRSYANGIGASPLIVAGSGYFGRVSTAGTPGAVNLTNANRVTTFGPQPAFGRGQADTRPQLELLFSSATQRDAAYFYMQTGATNSVDAEYDATKLTNPNGFNLASLSGSTQLAINGLAPLTSTDVVVPLTLGTPLAGSFEFEVASLANFSGMTVYLRDALTGTQQQLVAGSRYQFALATAATGGGRFSLVFQRSALASHTGLAAATVSLYPNPAHTSFTVLLPPLAGQASVEATLINALGQQVLTRSIRLNAAGASAEFRTEGLATGVYTLRLKAADQLLTKKLVIE